MPKLPSIKAALAHPLIRWPAIALTYVIVFMLLHHPMLSGEHYLGWDAVQESWGDIIYGFRALSHGELPLWNNLERVGYSFIGDPQTAVLYPFTWLTYLGSAIFGAGIWLPLFRFLIHLVISATGVHYLLQRRGYGRAACFTGGFTFVLCARLAKNKDNAGAYTAAWLPWLVIAGEELIRRPSARNGVALGVVGALCVLSGYSPDVFRNALALLPVFVVALVAALRTTSMPKRHLLRLGGALALALVVIGGLCMANVLATVDVIPLTARSAISSAEALRSSIRPDHLLHLISPRMLEPPMVYVYMGLLGTMLACFALLYRCDKERLLWGGAAAFFFLLTCGGNAFLLPVLSEVFPIFKLWRGPETYLYLVAFFLALLAARGMRDALEAGEGELHGARWRALGVSAIFFLIALAALAMGKDPTIPDPGQFHAVANAVWLTALTGVALRALLARKVSTRRVAAWIALVILIVDFGLQNRPIYDILRPMPRFTAEAPLLTLTDLGDHRVRVADDRRFTYRVGVRRNVRDFYARYSTLITKRYGVYRERARGSYNLLAAANVRYFTGQHAAAVLRSGQTQVKRVAGGLLELGATAPYAMWVGDPIVVGHATDALRRMEHDPPGRHAYLERRDLGPAERRHVAGLKRPERRAATLERLTHNSLRVGVDAPAPGVVVIHDAYHPGWEATVDGQPSRILRANYLFRAVFVEAGHHTIEMRFRPRGVIVGLWLYVLTFLSLLAYAGVSLRHRLRRYGRDPRRGSGGDRRAKNKSAPPRRPSGNAPQ